MKKKSDTILDKIQESVCKFYLNNKADCDFHYLNAENENIGTIYESISDPNTIQHLFAQVSIVILTANKYEKNILHHNIFNTQHEKIKKIEINLFQQHATNGETYAYWFQWQDYIILHVEAQKTGSYTLGGSADILRYILNSEYLYPTTIISLGICFGTNETKYTLGDVVISKKVYPYFIEAKLSETGYFVNDDNMFKINSFLSPKIKSVMDENSFNSLKTKVYFGNYVTGEAVVSNLKIRDAIANITKQEIIAGEMEGYGLFKECHNTSPSVPCIIIKSICDWAAMKNFDSKIIFDKLCDQKSLINLNEQNTIKDRIQAYAAFQAYNVLDILLSKHIFEPSIFKKVSEIIENSHENVIHANVLRREMYEISNKCKLSDSFILTIILGLMNNNLITYDGTDFDNCFNNVSDKTWKKTFSINKEGIKCQKPNLGLI